MTEKNRDKNVYKFSNSKFKRKSNKTSGIGEKTQLEMNTEVTVVSKDNGWCYVEVNGKKGYVSERLLSTCLTSTCRKRSMNERNKKRNNDTRNTLQKINNRKSISIFIKRWQL